VAAGHRGWRLGNTLRNWRREILAWHTTAASDGPTEGQNNLIKATKRVGFGFRTFPNDRTRVHSTQEASTGTYSQP
jgi:transposase